MHKIKVVRICKVTELGHVPTYVKHATTCSSVYATRSQSIKRNATHKNTLLKNCSSGFCGAWARAAKRQDKGEEHHLKSRRVDIYKL